MRIHKYSVGTSRCWCFQLDHFGIGTKKDDYIMRGDSMIVDPRGEVLAGPVFDTETILYADIDISVGRACNEIRTSV
ncbi:hypothetical protein JR666_001642 [Salmonella enterica]|nr:hypothetical protein [Salmonella enterica]